MEVAGKRCEKCNSTQVYFTKTKKEWNCRRCKHIEKDKGEEVDG